MIYDQFLVNRVAVIGGSSRGLGLGCAQQLAKSGATVVLCARNSNELQKAADKLRKGGSEVFPIIADMSKAEDNTKIIEMTITKYGRIDILINNSGGPQAGNWKEFSEKDWTDAFQSILMYNIRMISLATDSMKGNKWGRIINIASLSTKEPEASLVLSNVFRAGVIAFAKSISKELIKHGITINNLLPGAFKTDRAKELILKSSVATGKSPQEIENENKLKLPLGRYQEPYELGALVAFLCSDNASGITGTTISVDGGISSSLF